MKKVLIISSLVSSLLVNSQTTYADASKEENIGFASGAVSGALIAGPIGLIVGSVIGAVIGDGVEKRDTLKQANLQLNEKLNSQEERLTQEIAALQQQNDQYVVEQTSNLDAQLDSFTKGVTLNLMFTTGSYTLSQADKINIKQVANILTKYPQLSLKLDGYSDPVGKQSDNLKLSTNRAQSVKNAFEHYGISSNRLISEGHGEAKEIKIEDGQDTYAFARKVSVNFVTHSIEQVAQN